MRKVGLFIFIVVCLLLAAIAVPVLKALGFIIGILFSMIGSIFIVAFILFMVGYVLYLAIRENKENDTVDEFTKKTTSANSKKHRTTSEEEIFKIIRENDRKRNEENKK